MNNKKIISLDAETNGLWGQAFAVAAVVTDETGETETFLARCPIAGDVNPWVAENVLPQIAAVPETHSDYTAMLRDFVGFYMSHKSGADVIVHMGVPVEARLFLDARAAGILGDWDGPYPLIDIAALPEIGTSVDAYNSANGITVPTYDGGTHNPKFDAMAAALAYRHWLSTH